MAPPTARLDLLKSRGNHIMVAGWQGGSTRGRQATHGQCSFQNAFSGFQALFLPPIRQPTPGRTGSNGRPRKHWLTHSSCPPRQWPCAVAGEDGMVPCRHLPLLASWVWMGFQWIVSVSIFPLGSCRWLTIFSTWSADESRHAKRAEKRLPVCQSASLEPRQWQSCETWCFWLDKAHEREIRRGTRLTHKTARLSCFLALQTRDPGR